MKTLFTLALVLTASSAFAETKIVCETTEIIFNPKTGAVSGETFEAKELNRQIQSLEASGKKVKVVHQSMTYGGFQAVAAGVGSNFVNSKGVQYPTMCLTLEIQ